MRQLGPSTHSATITFYFCFFTGAFSYAGVVGQGNYHEATANEWSLLIQYVISGILFQLFQARAYAFEKAAKVALVQYTHIIFSYMMDVSCLEPVLQ